MMSMQEQMNRVDVMAVTMDVIGGVGVLHFPADSDWLLRGCSCSA